ncbi:squalene synthase HpnC [Phycisphaerales bacterium AB-hyl4]|uniref:Squalene synthase HpnC n=1 Tax=Natronomicrosphaera hydrolytica TaxID=3242702 RepID=A0ABV4U3X4_9BACT
MPSLVLDHLDTYGPDHCEPLNYEQATAYTAQLTRAQYENFTVVSWLLPKRLREHFTHIYAFCRWADDLGDETGDPQRSRELLDWWRDELDRCYAGEPRHPVYVALKPTIDRFDIPRKPFDDLIDAFIQDQTVTRYKTWEQLLDYCTRSANPVGRLVLYLCNHRDEQRQRLSDATCTALQLANFWQDVRRDILERGRVYIPADVANKHQLNIELLVKAVKLDADRETDRQACPSCSNAGPTVGLRAQLPAYRATLRELVSRTWPMFEHGRSLWPMIEPDVRVDIKLFTLGGERVLRMIERADYETARRRPKLGKLAKTGLISRALIGKLLTFNTAGRLTSPDHDATTGGSSTSSA